MTYFDRRDEVEKSVKQLVEQLVEEHRDGIATYARVTGHLQSIMTWSIAHDETGKCLNHIKEQLK